MVGHSGEQASTNALAPVSFQYNQVMNIDYRFRVKGRETEKTDCRANIAVRELS